MSIRLRRRRIISVLATGFTVLALASGCAAAQPVTASPTPAVPSSSEAIVPAPTASSMPSVQPAPTKSGTEFIAVDPWNDAAVEILPAHPDRSMAAACAVALPASENTLSCLTDSACIMNPSEAEVLCLADKYVLGEGEPLDITKWVRKSLDETPAPAMPNPTDQQERKIIALSLSDGRLCVASDAGGAEAPQGFNGMWGICDDQQLLWRPGSMQAIDLNAPFLDPSQAVLSVAVGENYDPDPSEVQVEYVYH